MVNTLTIRVGETHRICRICGQPLNGTGHHSTHSACQRWADEQKGVEPRRGRIPHPKLPMEAEAWQRGSKPKPGPGLDPLYICRRLCPLRHKDGKWQAL